MAIMHCIVFVIALYGHDGHTMLAVFKTCCSFYCVLQGEAVAEVAAIWGCKKSIAKTLLMHHMWDKEKLLGESTAHAQHCF